LDKKKSKGYLSPVDYILEVEQEEFIEMPSIFDTFDL
jgi:hypothetical protein